MESRSRRPEAPTPGYDTDAAVAAFIGEAAAELSMLANRHDLPILAYILDMARLEAESQADVPPEQ